MPPTSGRASGVHRAQHVVRAQPARRQEGGVGGGEIAVGVAAAHEACDAERAQADDFQRERKNGAASCLHDRDKAVRRRVGDPFLDPQRALRGSRNAAPGQFDIGGKVVRRQDGHQRLATGAGPCGWGHGIRRLAAK